MGDYNGDWVTMRHADTEGTARFPATPQVVKAYEALGWAVVEEPEEDAEPQEAKPKSRTAAKVKE
jgi:hypothetical protein